MGLLSARLQVSSGMGTPTVPQRSSTLLPTELRTRATAVWTRGAWQRRSSASPNSTPERLSGSAQRRRVSMNATADDGLFWNCTRSNRRQSQIQGLSWRPLSTNNIKVNQSILYRTMQNSFSKSICHLNGWHIMLCYNVLSKKAKSEAIQHKACVTTRIVTILLLY